MAEILLTAGFASTKRQVDRTAQALSEHYNKDVEGITYTDALRKTGAFFSGRELVVTHSGGIDALDRSSVKAERVISIAPPVPHTITGLVTRGFKKMRQCEDAFGGTFKQSSLYEGLSHSMRSMQQIRNLSNVNGFEIAHDLAKRGTDMTLALMSDDGLFDYQSHEAQEAWFDATSPHVANKVKVTEVAGDHIRFTNDPVKVLGEIAAAKLLSSPRFISRLHTSPSAQPVPSVALATA